uniref:IS630 transposase-related protein n=1 Tax=Nitrosococcus watsonii TaxID=473531 RepID=UPI000300E46C|nr:IS630 transposase-related protein [Nitrosococcus watsonii]
MDNRQPKVHGFRRGKIDKIVLKAHAQECPGLYLHERAAIFDVHTSSMGRMLKKLGIVKKKERQYKERCMMKRQEFCEKLKAEHRMFGFKNLIYVDETGFDTPTHRPSGWTVKGCKTFDEIKS